MKAQDIMTENPNCCTCETPLQGVARMMIDSDCGCIPVMESEQSHRLVGVISDRDIVCRAVAQGKDPKTTPASEAMSSPVVTVATDADLDECCRIMERNQIRRVPVVNNAGRCCGMISLADIAEKTDETHAAAVVREVSHHSFEPSRVGSV